MNLFVFNCILNIIMYFQCCYNGFACIKEYSLLFVEEVALVMCKLEIGSGRNGFAFAMGL